MEKLSKSESLRFWSKVDRRSGDECWIWQSATDSWGYGKFYLRGKTPRASRIAASESGMGVSGRCVLHRCDTPLCCNPAHLFMGTHQENMTDKSRKGRSPRGSGHWRSKLSPECILEIRASSQSGPELAARFGVNKSTIGKIRRREIWAHM